MHGANMVNRHSAGGGDQPGCSRKVQVAEGRVNAAHEPLGSMMTVYGSAMAPGQDQQRTIALIDIVQEERDRQQIVVRVGIIGPILVPLDGSSDLPRLDVELA